MDSKIRINLKKYFLFATPIILGSMVVVRSMEEFFAVVVGHLAVMVNQALLYYGVTELLNPRYLNDVSERPTKKIVFAFISKLIVLAVTLCFCEHFLGKRVIILLLSYVLLIFVMYFSIEKKEDHEKEPIDR